VIRKNRSSSSLERELVPQGYIFEFDRGDTLEWYLALGPIVEALHHDALIETFPPGTKGPCLWH
jgi:hypothetical protein